MIERALEGKTVVRLKGGDPLVFGRGGEEAEELAAAGIPFAIVPGISAALGAAAAAGIPLTHRDDASTLTLATAHGACQDDGAERVLDLPAEGTLVFYMVLGRLDATCSALIAGGRSASTPAAVIAHATLPQERVVVGTLRDVATLAQEGAVGGPAVLVVGNVVARRVAPTSSPGPSTPWKA